MRANYFRWIPSEIQLLSSLEAQMESYSFGESLLELIKLRVSQMNGCAFCVSLHTQQLRIFGESNERIDLISVWEEASCYTDRERAALRWAEALTRLPDGSGVSDELYETTVAEFGEEAISQLSLAVAMINTWNRLAVPFRTDHKHIPSLLKHPVRPTC
ncbi:carboxymuconolactone decarboxylase family protein [Roseiconus lacunae]|uniref:carboxymuconolactone decarboxylase family protein n=1 Tax=Roseiconus lacunae TaxID=2605694 RepID=UPI001E53E474|nr:carboxymuconolactone decarboxylase family protein [Roseiconus lacunae]MCD0461967.1 carboxymuconolactone decarboxylase family protein [Roseiconus lacunae]